MMQGIVYVRCSMFHCIAVCCSVLQCVAACRSASVMSHMNDARYCAKRQKGIGGGSGHYEMATPLGGMGWLW